MRTTIDIQQELLDEVMKLTGAKTKNQAVNEALKSQIQRAKRKRLLTRKGTIDLNIDLDKNRQR
ncbi:MAG: type II toxin-antitoxin system VapB family antitoxin [Balneolaceae bacterium]|nr:type II toxin-antitoxin system VapB family antitoxin [Balneolaceae bacterium]